MISDSHTSPKTPPDPPTHKTPQKTPFFLGQIWHSMGPFGCCVPCSTARTSSKGAHATPTAMGGRPLAHEPWIVSNRRRHLAPARLRPWQGNFLHPASAVWPLSTFPQARNTTMRTLAWRSSRPEDGEVSLLPHGNGGVGVGLWWVGPPGRAVLG